MTKQEIKTKLKNINSKLKRLLNEMNVMPKTLDKNLIVFKLYL